MLGPVWEGRVLNFLAMKTSLLAYFDGTHRDIRVGTQCGEGLTLSSNKICGKGLTLSRNTYVERALNILAMKMSLLT
jgi:hypothetical protein